MNSLFRSLITTLFVASLIGCTSKPDDAQAIKHITDSEAEAGSIKVANIQRKNGWTDTEQTYKVEYTYDLIAEKDYVDLVFGLIDHIEKNSAQWFPEDEIQSLNWRLILRVASTDSSQDNSFASIARTNVVNSDDAAILSIGKRLRTEALPPALQAYLDQGTGTANAPPDKVYRWRNLLYAMHGLAKERVFEKTKKGDVIQSKQWTLTFRKTEKGWLLAN